MISKMIIRVINRENGVFDKMNQNMRHEIYFTRKKIKKMIKRIIK